MKPFSVNLRETKLAVSQTLNQSGLPIDTVVSVLKDLYDEARQLAEMSYQQDLAKMNEAAKGESDGDTDKKRNKG